MGEFLISGGPTFEYIDKVRGITNRFKGNTSCFIALYFANKGEHVVLANSNRELVELRGCLHHPNIEYVPFVTVNDLKNVMHDLLTDPNRHFDAVIHSSAVSDETPTGVFYMDESGKLVEIDRSKKIKSDDHAVKYIRTELTPKIVDFFREWGFLEPIAKFKLQVGMPDEELIEISTRSMHHSDANLIVANCLEWAHERAYIIDADDSIHSVGRDDLPAELYRRLAQ